MSDHLNIPFPTVASYWALATLLPAVATIITAARLNVRRGDGHAYGADDVFLVLSLIFFWGLSVLVVLGIKNGFFGNAPTPPLQQGAEFPPGFTYYQEMEYAALALATLQFGSVKISIVCFYRRIFVVGKGKLYKLFIFALILSIIWTVAFLFIQLFHCGTHFSDAWYYKSTPRCLYGLTRILAWAVTDIVTDMLIFVLPLPTIWKLQLPLRRKFAVTVIFSLGVVSITAAAIRLALHIQEYMGKYHTPYADSYPTLAFIFFLNQVEGGTALIAASLPLLQRPFTFRFIQSALERFQATISLSSFKSRIPAPKTRGRGASTRWLEDEESLRTYRSCSVTGLKRQKQAHTEGAAEMRLSSASLSPPDTLR